MIGAARLLRSAFTAPSKSLRYRCRPIRPTSDGHFSLLPDRWAISRAIERSLLFPQRRAISFFPHSLLASRFPSAPQPLRLFFTNPRSPHPGRCISSLVSITRHFITAETCPRRGLSPRRIMAIRRPAVLLASIAIRIGRGRCAGQDDCR